MNHLVTGHLGFIGQHLARRLEALGDTVIGVDAKEGNRVEDFVVESMSLFPPDMIWHLASPVGPFRMTADQNIAWEIMAGAKVVLEAAKRWKCKLALFSSAEVNGTPQGLVVRQPYTVRTPYQAGKIAMEAMAMASDYQDIQIIRPENVVGPGQDSAGGFVLARFVEQYKRGEPLTVFYPGTQVRRFLSVHDFVDFCMLLKDNWTKKRVWDVHGKRRISMLRLAQTISNRWVIVPHPTGYVEGEPRDTVEDTVDVEPASLMWGGQTATIPVIWTPQRDLLTILGEVLRD